MKVIILTFNFLEQAFNFQGCYFIIIIIISTTTNFELIPIFFRKTVF